MTNSRYETLASFSEHEIQQSHDATHIQFKHPDTTLYSLDIVFTKDHIFIAGDLGYSTYHTTWDGRDLSKLKDIYPSYLFEKLVATSDGPFCYTENKFDQDMQDELKYIKPQYQEPLHNYIKDIKTQVDFTEDYRKVEQEMYNVLQNHPHMHRNYHEDFHRFGRMYHPRLMAHHKALTLIAKKLTP